MDEVRKAMRIDYFEDSEAIIKTYKENFLK